MHSNPPPQLLPVRAGWRHVPGHVGGLTYQGTVKLFDSPPTVLWSCEHAHGSTGDALDCAEAALDAWKELSHPALAS